MDLNKTVKDIEQILLTEQSSTITNRSDIGASQLRRNELSTLLQELYEPYARLVGQVHDLPALPDSRHMDWAESILSLFNLAIVVLDMTSLKEDADIIRIYTLSGGGNPLCDIVIRPQRELTPNTAWTGITQEELDIAPTIGEAWPRILPLLKGHYFVSFNLEFVERRLKNNIEHYGLERLPFLGNCLMKKAKAFFGIDSYGHGSGLKLADAVARIGKPFPYSPPLAQDRALGCLNLILAMSNGVTSAPKSLDAGTDLGELDSVEDHPF